MRITFERENKVGGGMELRQTISLQEFLTGQYIHLRLTEQQKLQKQR